MNQNIWGPKLWFFLHSLTLNYPVKPEECDKKKIIDFFTSLENILPCKYCRQNYKRNLVEFPIRANSKKDLFEWLVDLHNEVNGLEGKKTYSYKEILKIYENEYDKKFDLQEDFSKNDRQLCKNNMSDYIPLFLIFIFAIISYLYFYGKK